MAKFTDVVRNTLQGYFNMGDQPTEAEFAELISDIQQGIEEHEHDGTGDGDGVDIERIARDLAAERPFNSKGNDFATIQAAINDLAGDGWVYVPTGTWVENLTIVDDYVTLYGAGWSTFINGGSGLGEAINISGGYCVVRSLVAQTIVGAGNNNTIAASGAGVRILDVYIYDSDYIGIALTGANPYVERCRVNGTTSSGIYVGNAGARIRANTITNIGAVGIQMVATGDEAIVTENIIDTTGDDGIYIHTDAERCIVIGNRIKDYTGEGIDDDSGTSVVAHNIVTP